MEFNILETILNSVALGLGITLVPQSAVHHLSKAGKVHCHAIPEKYAVFQRFSYAVKIAI